jgi:predicted metal-dependent HD superfamily phosphohydrolase
MKFVEKQVYALLKKHLSDRYLFHNVEHTKEVVKDVETLAKKEGLKTNDIKILKLAALFHDTGYIFSYDEHEKFSADIAKEMLLESGMKKWEVNKITKLILATKLTHKPKNVLEKIIKDADTSYLGKRNFMKKSELLRRELFLVKRIFYTDEEWYEHEIKFLESHKYYTKSAEGLWGPGKKRNLQKLKEALVQTRMNL